DPGAGEDDHARLLRLVYLLPPLAGRQREHLEPEVPPAGGLGRDDDVGAVMGARRHVAAAGELGARRGRLGHSPSLLSTSRLRAALSFGVPMPGITSCSTVTQSE